MGSLDTVTETIIGAAIDVHRELGPGLLESAYAACLHYELRERGLSVERERIVPVRYKDLEIEAGFRIDLLVEQNVVVELKAIERLDRIHEVQLFSYLKLLNKRVGLLINFHVPVLTRGIRRIVNGYEE